MAKLGDMLVDEGLITRDQLQKALSMQKQKHEFLGSILVKNKFIEESALLDILTRQTGYPIIDLGNVELSENLKKLVPWEMARKDLLVPVQEMGSMLHVAMVNPENPAIIDNLAFRTGKKIKVSLTGYESLQKAWNKLYGDIEELETDMLVKGLDGLRDKMIKKAKQLSSEMAIVGKDYSAVEEEDDSVPEEEPKDIDVEEFDEIVTGALGSMEVVTETKDEESAFGLSVAAEAPPIINLVNGILLKAINMGASDIHIEPFEKEFRVRFRIDGVLHLVMKLPTSVKNSVTSRLKIMASCDIAERRIPQDGRVKVKLGKTKQVEFRVNMLPSVFGEKIVIRVLGQTNLQPHVKELGFAEKQLADVLEAIRAPYGMILVTGPTGSGKSTTLYTALNQLNTIEKNITTAEDPVEFNLHGVTQVPVRAAIGFTFALALRAFLRQDPDIIMVGEMRDAETCTIGVRAALTGHLVFSTLHTNDAPSTVVRLLDMGVDKFLVAAATKLVIAQRLVRRICKNCAEEVPLDDNDRQQLQILSISEEIIQGLNPVKGKGCEKCNKIGYKGRAPVFEVMPVKDEKLIEAITTNQPTEVLAKVCREIGIWSLKDSAIDLVRKQITTLDEAFKIAVAK